MGALAGLAPGALAGLAPGGLAAILLAVLGAVGFLSAGSTVDLAVGAVLIGTFAVVVGWLVEPTVGGTIRDDFAAGCSYVIVVCLLYLVFGTIASTWEEVADGLLRGPLEVVLAMGFLFAYGLLNLPWLTAVVAPFAAVWVAALRLLRRSEGRIIGCPS